MSLLTWDRAWKPLPMAKTTDLFLWICCALFLLQYGCENDRQNLGFKSNVLSALRQIRSEKRWKESPFSSENWCTVFTSALNFFSSFCMCKGNTLFWTSYIWSARLFWLKNFSFEWEFLDRPVTEPYSRAYADCPNSSVTKASHIQVNYDFPLILLAS